MAESASVLRTPQMENFNKAMRSLGDPVNRPTVEERSSGTAELSDRRKRLLVPASVELIKSTGISEEQIQQKTNGDISAIIIWAIRINNDKNEELNKKLKS